MAGVRRRTVARQRPPGASGSLPLTEWKRRRLTEGAGRRRRRRLQSSGRPPTAARWRSSGNKPSNGSCRLRFCLVTPDWRLNGLCNAGQFRELGCSLSFNGCPMQAACCSHGGGHGAPTRLMKAIGYISEAGWNRCLRIPAVWRPGNRTEHLANGPRRLFGSAREMSNCSRSHCRARPLQREDPDGVSRQRSTNTRPTIHRMERVWPSHRPDPARKKSGSQTETGRMRSKRSYGRRTAVLEPAAGRPTA